MKLKKTRYAFLFSALAISSGQAGPLYWGGGTTDIADGTPIPAATTSAPLSGNWDTVTKNWSADPTTTIYQAYATATDVSLGLVGAGAVDPGIATINLEADSNFTFTGRLYGGMWSATGFGQVFNLNTAAGVATVTLGGTSAVFDFTNSSAGNTAVRGLNFSSNASGTNAVKVAGSAQMVVRGGSRVNINSDSSGYTGAVRVENGSLFIGNFGAASNANLNAATSFDVRNVDVGNGLMSQQASLTNAMPTLTLGYTSTAVSDAIGDTAPVTLRGGQLTFRGIRSATPTAETADQLTIDGWGYLDLANLSSGTAGSGLDAQLTFTNGLSRLSNRNALLVGVNATGTLAGNTSNVVFTGGSAAFGSNLLPWMTTTRAEFVKFNSDALEVIPSTAAATDLGTWAGSYGASSDIRVGNGTAFTPSNTIGNTTVNSLGLFPSGTTTLAQAASTVITVQSGGIAYQAGGNVTISGGTITTGTPATTPLYVNAGGGTGAKLTITSAIAGANMDFVKSGLADMEFAPGAGVTDNTFTGTTYANGGQLILNRQDTTPTATNKISIPGNLVINTGSRVGVSRGGQFAASSAVTINEGGMLNLSGGGLTTTGVITINGGRIQEQNQGFTASSAGNGLVFNGGYIASSTAFPTDNVLGTDVQYQSTAISPALWIQYQGIRTGAAQNWNLSLGGGTRTFSIANSSTLAVNIPEMTLGARIITGGKLIKAGDGVLRLIGSAANNGTVHSGSNTYSGGTDVNNGTLIAGFEAANPAATGNAVVVANGGMMVFDKPIKLVVGQKLTGFDNFVASVISPTQILMISSGGASGLPSSTTRASFSFDATVARNGGLGTGAVAVNSTGTLQLDSGSSVSPPVTVSTGGTLTGSGTVSGAVSAGGTISPGVASGISTGTLTLDSTLTFTSGSKLAVDLGTSSDSVTFTSLADSLGGSGIATLQVTPGAGFSYGSTYTIISNVTTAGFTFGSITGYDTVNFTAAVAKSGNNYVLSFTPASGGNYASWANSNGIPGEPAIGDFDKDGLSNLVEYALGSNPTTSSVPAGTFAGGILTFTKGTDARTNGDVNYVIETSTDLVIWSPQVTQNAPNASATITYTLPTGQPKVFGRLKVTQIP